MPLDLQEVYHYYYGKSLPVTYMEKSRFCYSLSELFLGMEFKDRSLSFIVPIKATFTRYNIVGVYSKSIKWVRPGLSDNKFRNEFRTACN